MTRHEEDQTLKIETKFVAFMSDFWDEYDTDQDGFLNKDEFKRFLVEVYFEGELEEDDDKPINASDAKLRLSKTMDKTQSFQSKYEEVFDEFDINGDGLIDKEEMFSFLAQMFGLDRDKFNFERVMKIYQEHQNSQKAGQS